MATAPHNTRPSKEGPLRLVPPNHVPSPQLGRTLVTLYVPQILSRPGSPPSKAPILHSKSFDKVHRMMSSWDHQNLDGLPKLYTTVTPPPTPQCPQSPTVFVTHRNSAEISSLGGTTRLPLEVVDRILRYVALDQDTLWACALVNQVWNLAATLRLWRRPVLRTLSTVDLFNRTLASASCAIMVGDHHTVPWLDGRPTTHSYLDYIVHLDFTSLDSVQRNSSRLSRLMACTLRYIRISSLQTLDLGFCKGLSNYHLQRLAPQLGSLETLNLAGSGRQDIVLAKLVQHTPRLTRLSLAWNIQLTTFGIIQLAHRCPQLQYLDLSHCSLVEDTAVIALATRCRQLQVLYVSYCHSLTDVAIMTILHHCAHLRVLNALGCPGVSQALLDEIPERYPKLLINHSDSIPFRQDFDTL
ncbi:hypothetical protein IWQ62_000061 [Dispira parvispora]|uniref:F-box domain-containing protein n=1 Tax=Dispira parvispora TaxID=1520584 RepID=A0A9W8AWQ9_9FUNG|nr:hypothetical protein IWQ62_000061 [Dispira parvispora]